MSDRRYGSPGDFRRALTDRLRALSEQGRWTLPQLQRQIAYDRLLARLYQFDDGWIVKGATALLARDIGVRGTIDVDVYRAKASDAAARDLREAAGEDLGDWFRFEIGAPAPVSDGAAGIRLPVKAYIGATEWVSFRVDLVGTDLRMTGQPEEVPPLAQVNMPEVVQRNYRAYPLVDHIADKIAAILQRYGDGSMPSTRYKDLVDLVAIVIEVSVGAEPQAAALRSEIERRGITPVPHRFDVPDRGLWEAGYAAEAKDSALEVGRTLDEALAIVTPFVDALLAGTAFGAWDAASGAWAG
ncbi:MAG: nucleotidyl transferase AbiEii/AbiGii toxin family protein [Gaiellaceae bacterium]